MKAAALLLFSTALAAAKPVIINDTALIHSLVKGIGVIADCVDHLTAKDLAKALAKAPAKTGSLTLAEESPGDRDTSVYLVGSVYKCGKCDKWHAGGIASGWALTTDGVLVSNYHVFENAKGAAMGVCDRDGNTFPITGILAADKDADVAIFRIDADNLTPLALGPSAETGSRVHVISHPARRFFMRTTGEVSRYHLRPATKGSKASTWMSITADYAKGSSGGPVMDDHGRVVGMVSNTQSIYYDSSNRKDPKGPLQMVVKNCVPVSAIRGLLGEAPADIEEPPAKERSGTAAPAGS